MSANINKDAKMKDEPVIVKIDIVGDLDKDNWQDRFQIMQNREVFDLYFVNCLVYLFSEHVNGFFDSYCLPSIIDNKTSLFQDREEAIDRSGYILSLFDRFDFVQLKLVDEKHLYVMSTIDDAAFGDCVRKASKFCKDFGHILDVCLDVFKKWIVYSEHNKTEGKKDA